MDTSTKAQGSPVDPAHNDVIDVYENKLRPKSFTHYIGQEDVKKNLSLFATAAKQRGEVLDHTLLYGPPGLGKTTLCMILAEEMGANLRITSGPALEKPGDLAAILTNIKEGDFLFIDEIHRLRRPVEEILYSAMEDFALDLVIGKGPTARTMRISIPQFTLVGATTRASMLAGPLRDRFGHIEKLRYYEVGEIQQIIERSSQILGAEIESSGAALLAKSARRTPRIANRLLRRMRDFAQVLHNGTITQNVVSEGLKSLSVNDQGLDFADQQYLDVLRNRFRGGPVGLNTLAAAIGEDPSTVEDMIEPYLIREGYLLRTPKGRMLVGFES